MAFRYAAFFKKYVLLFFVLSLFVFGCSTTATQKQSEPRYTYHEFDGVVVFYKTDDVKHYRELLPTVFQMPDEPLVMTYIIDFYDMDEATQPYQEAAVFLLAQYNGKPAWHCVTMPVTSDEARLGGIYYLGYPKIMGDIQFKRVRSKYRGHLKLDGRTVMTITHNTKGHMLTSEERNWFERLKGIPQLNIRNGKVYQPKFGSGGEERTPLQLAEQFPDKFEVKVGKSELVLDAQAAGGHSARLADIFSIEPTDIVLAYYFKNKFVLRFQL